MRQRQRGSSLLEALIAFLVLSLGLAGAMHLQSWLRNSSDLARLRTEATRLAQQDMEQVRAFADPAAFEALADHHSKAPAGSASLALTRTVTPHAAHIKTSQVQVSWPDRAGLTHSVQLQASLASAAPVYSAALALPPQDHVLAPRRHLPRGVQQLSDGRHVLRPSAASRIAWVLNSATGMVEAQCAVSATPIAAESLAGCTAVAGHLLSGHVRFSLAATPDAAEPADKPLPLQVALTLSAASPDAPHCETEPHAADRYTAYTCLVLTTAESPSWSGQLLISPTGWLIGEAPGHYKVCRYSSDLDASGRIDHNDEHPAHYTDVRGPLSAQNYLVIRGEAACPRAVPPHNEASTATVQHQP